MSEGEGPSVWRLLIRGTEWEVVARDTESAVSTWARKAGSLLMLEHLVTRVENQLMIRVIEDPTTCTDVVYVN